ncbi:Metallo-dependent phosphatase-like protein [Dissophora ornata]|nr:Metallo-dependent phosphatase-like protein [Dissophora ornata]
MRALFAKALQTRDCGACVSSIEAAKGVAFTDQNSVLATVKSLCPTLKDTPLEVCNGLVNMYGPPLLDVILKANVTGGDGILICHSIGAKKCSTPATIPGTITFPKPRPANPVVPAPSGNLVDVLHLSDWHVDELYNTSCRASSTPSTSVNSTAASWGDYNCDTPVKLTLDLLQYIPKVVNAQFAIMTGDVPPHDTWRETNITVVPIEEHAYENMAKALPIKVYPTVGNHETGPASLFPTQYSGGNDSSLYASLADDWSRWLPADAVNTVKNYGAYTVSPSTGFRIVSLNTNFCLSENFYLYANTSDYDPFGELNWLVTQLQAAEDAGERVWIMGHVPPSLADCLQNWSALYYQAVQRYSPHVIAEQFFGHTHIDEFALYYGPGNKTAQNAIATSWIGPSVTPYKKLNPGFRVYKVDSKSWNVFDSETYIANLNLALSWDASGSTPNWHLEYSARQAYGVFAPIADDAPLSASWWHEVTAAMETNNTAFQEFWTYRGKSADLFGECAADSPCQTQIICNLRAGMSSETCKSLKAKKQKRSETENASKPLDQRSLFQNDDSAPWDQKMCGRLFGP